LHHIKKYNAKCFLFNDDEFIVDKNRVKELCEKIIKAKEKNIINKGILFNCQVRVIDFISQGEIDYELIDKLAKAGFHSLGLGIETFSDRMMSMPSMNKVGCDCEKTLKIISIMLDKGIVPHVFQIIFFPESNKEDIKINIRNGMEVVRKGAQLVVTPILRFSPGAPISKNPVYNFTSKIIENKFHNEKLKIGINYIPFDPFLADCANKIEDAIDKEISNFKWKYGRIHKSIIGILSYIATAKLLKEEGLVKEGYELIDYKIKELELRKEIKSEITNE